MKDTNFNFRAFIISSDVANLFSGDTALTMGLITRLDVVDLENVFFSMCLMNISWCSYVLKMAPNHVAFMLLNQFKLTLISYHHGRSPSLWCHDYFVNVLLMRRLEVIQYTKNRWENVIVIFSIVWPHTNYKLKGYKTQLVVLSLSYFSKYSIDLHLKIVSDVIPPKVLLYSLTIIWTLKFQWLEGVLFSHVKDKKFKPNSLPMSHLALWSMPHMIAVRWSVITVRLLQHPFLINWSKSIKEFLVLPLEVSRSVGSMAILIRYWRKVIGFQ